MRVPRTELRDELTALIAAGRELSPDHDQALAEVFIDRVASRSTHVPHTRQARALWRKPRRLLGAVLLGLACLGTASVLSTHQAGSVNPVSGPQSANVQAVPVPRKVPHAPPLPKMPPAPLAPVPKTSP